MKLLPLLLGGLSVALILSSCGDKDASVNQSDGSSQSPQSADAYPLQVCVVSGEKLGSMGEPHVITHNGTEVRFCCDKCVPKFNEDPDKYLAKLKAGQAGSNP